MSVRVMSVVWQDAKEYREGPLLVLLALADWANDEGWCWPSVPAIAAKARLTERQVYNVLRGLQRDGVIVRKGGGGRGNATRYQVVVASLGRPKNPEKASGFTGPQKAQKDEAGCRVSKTQNPEIGDTKTLKSDASQYIEPSVEPSEKNNTPLPPSQASGERGEECPGWDDDAELADAVICAVRVTGKRRQRNLRETLLGVIAQERASDGGLCGDELQELLVESWEDHMRSAPRLRWAFASPEKFFASPLWRNRDAWPWLQASESGGAPDPCVGLYRGPE